MAYVTDVKDLKDLKNTKDGKIDQPMIKDSDIANISQQFLGRAFEQDEDNTKSPFDKDVYRGSKYLYSYKLQPDEKDYIVYDTRFGTSNGIAKFYDLNKVCWETQYENNMPEWKGKPLYLEVTKSLNDNETEIMSGRKVYTFNRKISTLYQRNVGSPQSERNLIKFPADKNKDLKPMK
jgi:hypothetical protein